MSYRLELGKRFFKEVEVIRDWYDSEGAGLGNYFLDIVDHRLEKLKTHPHAFAKAKTKGSRRRIVLHPFPYAIYYSVRGKKVRVTRCYSTHRKPLY